MSRRGQKRGIFVALKERCHAFLPLRFKYRADAIEQAPAHGQQRPSRAQELRLQTRQLPHIGFAPQPTHIRVTAHNARGRTGRIQQYRIELLPRRCRIFSE